MKTVNHGEDLRWITLVIVLANTVFNYLINVWPLGKPIQEITSRYHTLFTPADYAFSIWGVIYFSFIIYAIYQLLPAQRDKLLFNDLSVSLICTNILACIWVIAFSNNYIGLSMLINIAMFVFGFHMFTKMKHARNHYVYNSWLTVPFSLYLGWITVACIANADIWLASIGWPGGPLNEPAWTIVLIVAIALAGITICLAYKDFTYPLVISWAFIAIWVVTRFTHSGVAFTALIAGIVVFLAAVVFVIKTYFLHKQQPYYTGKAVMKIIR
jgi:hypothetical protein